MNWEASHIAAFIDLSSSEAKTQSQHSFTDSETTTSFRTWTQTDFMTVFMFYQPADDKLNPHQFLSVYDKRHLRTESENKDVKKFDLIS